MKFALVALVASATAIKVEAPGCPVSMAVSNLVFKSFDTNNNGVISKAEFGAKYKSYGFSDKIVAKIVDETFEKIGATNGEITPAQFNKYSNTQPCQPSM